MVCFKNPSPKGGGFFVCGDTKKGRDGTGGILSGKGCMTLTMTKELKLVLLVDFIWKRVYDNPDKIPRWW